MPRERKGVSTPKSKIRDIRRYFVIASEGADTERIYFESLAEKIRKNGALDKLIKVEFLVRQTEAERKKSSHKHIIKQLDGYKKTFSICEGDELWLLIDRDKQNNPTENIANIAQSCLQKGYSLALSNPCFELWLLLHVQDIKTYNKEILKQIFENKKVSTGKNFLDRELSTLLNGYNKSKYDVNLLLKNLHQAVEQAKALDANLQERWIETHLGTRIYILVENIFDGNIPLQI